jgi:tRNA(adenine34) deaminase
MGAAVVVETSFPHRFRIGHAAVQVNPQQADYFTGYRSREMVLCKKPNRNPLPPDMLFSIPLMGSNPNDEAFMRAALEAARSAEQNGEVPVGAVIVIDGCVISRAGNRTITDCDPAGHAEIIALREAAREIKNYRLLGATIYVTIEPCAMCAGAMIQARVARLVYGADDAKAGAVRSCFSILEHEKLNHRVEVTSGVLADECAALLKSFFAARR